MKFCPKCGSMMLPSGDEIKCKCGYVEGLSKDEMEAEYKFEADRNEQQKVIVTSKDDVVLPTTKITCYKCGGTVGYWWTLQTRSADEAPTYFIRCANCGNTWRQSN